ncbi:hypothetical protein CGT81_16505 [Vibrio cholerae]|uniref:hypothetical protein n=1 Tax=Vibrio cholerae TaxID=666 RepID=UPI000BA92B65|nr:hypothetical protein [Vibrio cholerae]PAR95649.1 hypothetical protein CGT81_16505 [Vibrio cholerae]
MRTETDAFYQKDDDGFQTKGMLMPDGDIGISAQDQFDVITVSLSKRKAAKLARQILELSGETKQKLAAENKRLREALKASHEWLSIDHQYAGSPLEHSNTQLLSKLGGE